LSLRKQQSNSKDLILIDCPLLAENNHNGNGNLHYTSASSPNSLSSSCSEHTPSLSPPDSSVPTNSPSKRNGSTQSSSGNASLPHKLRHKVTRNNTNQNTDSDSGSDSTSTLANPASEVHSNQMTLNGNCIESQSNHDSVLRSENYALRSDLQRLASEVASLKNVLVCSPTNNFTLASKQQSRNNNQEESRSSTPGEVNLEDHIPLSDGNTNNCDSIVSVNGNQQILNTKG
jgi:hypothetical protein